MQRLLPVLALALLCACGATTPPTPAAQASPSPVALSCTDSGDASASWAAPSTAPSTPAIVSATASGDKLQITCAYDPTLAQKLPILRKAPSHFVTWGDGSSDEMCLAIVGWVDS